MCNANKAHDQPTNLEEILILTGWRPVIGVNLTQHKFMIATSERIIVDNNGLQKSVLNWKVGGKAPYRNIYNRNVIIND